MSDPIQGGGDGAGKPEGNGAPANAPSVTIDELVSAVAAKLEGNLANMVTGAVKRNVASALEGLDLAKLKGNADAPKDGDDKGKKLSPAEVQLAEVKRQVEALTKESQTYKSRALRAGVAELVTKANVTPEAAELLTDKFAGMVVEDESGKLHVKSGDESQPFSDFLTGYLKDRKGLLKSQAREGSGAGAGGGWSEAMPKTRRELMSHPTNKGPDGKPVPTPERAAAFKAAHPDMWDKLPI